MLSTLRSWFQWPAQINYGLWLALLNMLASFVFGPMSIAFFAEGQVVFGWMSVALFAITFFTSLWIFERVRKPDAENSWQQEYGGYTKQQFVQDVYVGAEDERLIVEKVLGRYGFTYTTYQEKLREIQAYGTPCNNFLRGCKGLTGPFTQEQREHLKVCHWCKCVAYFTPSTLLFARLFKMTGL